NHYDEELGFYCSPIPGFPVSQPHRLRLHRDPAGPFFITQVNPNLVPEWKFKSTETRDCHRNADRSVTCVDDGMHPNGFEWCINAPAVDGAGNVYVESEDGNIYVLDQGHSGVFTSAKSKLLRISLSVQPTRPSRSTTKAGFTHRTTGISSRLVKAARALARTARATVPTRPGAIPSEISSNEALTRSSFPGAMVACQPADDWSERASFEIVYRGGYDGKNSGSVCDTGCQSGLVGRSVGANRRVAARCARSGGRRHQPADSHRERRRRERAALRRRTARDGAPL